MTVDVRLSVNGNYKLPVKMKQGERVEEFVISGRGHEGPNVKHITFYHGKDAMNLEIGPEEPDNGD